MFAQYCFLVPRVSKRLLRLCADSQAIDRNRWKPSKNQVGCRTSATTLILRLSTQTMATCGCW